jgi:hypothetical protein
VDLRGIVVRAFDAEAVIVPLLLMRVLKDAEQANVLVPLLL